MNENNEGWDFQQHNVYRNAPPERPIGLWVLAIAGGLYLLASFAEWFGI